MMDDRWSNALTRQQISENSDLKSLAAVIVDQQFDYWYDPCGKSGHDLNELLTPRARTAMQRLREVLWHGGEKKNDGRR